MMDVFKAHRTYTMLATRVLSYDTLGIRTTGHPHTKRLCYHCTI